MLSSHSSGCGQDAVPPEPRMRVSVGIRASVPCWLLAERDLGLCTEQCTAWRERERAGKMEVDLCDIHHCSVLYLGIDSLNPAHTQGRRGLKRKNSRRQGSLGGVLEASGHGACVWGALAQFVRCEGDTECPGPECLGYWRRSLKDFDSCKK